MYDVKSELLIKNSINRNLRNSPMLPSMKKNEDETLILRIQKDSPGKAQADVMSVAAMNFLSCEGFHNEFCVCLVFMVCLFIPDTEGFTTPDLADAKVSPESLGRIYLTNTWSHLRRRGCWKDEWLRASL